MKVSTKEVVGFWLENFVARDSLNKFYMLLWIVIICIFIHAYLFLWVTGGVDMAADTGNGGSDKLDFWKSLYYMAQTVITGTTTPI